MAKFALGRHDARTARSRKGVMEAETEPRSSTTALAAQRRLADRPGQEGKAIEIKLPFAFGTGVDAEGPRRSSPASSRR